MPSQYCERRRNLVSVLPERAQEQKERSWTHPCERHPDADPLDAPLLDPPHDVPQLDAHALSRLADLPAAHDRAPGKARVARELLGRLGALHALVLLVGRLVVEVVPRVRALEAAQRAPLAVRRVGAVKVDVRCRVLPAVVEEDRARGGRSERRARRGRVEERVEPLEERRRRVGLVELGRQGVPRAQGERLGLVEGARGGDVLVGGLVRLARLGRASCGADCCEQRLQGRRARRARRPGERCLRLELVAVVGVALNPELDAAVAVAVQGRARLGRRGGEKGERLGERMRFGRGRAEDEELGGEGGREGRERGGGR